MPTLSPHTKGLDQSGSTLTSGNTLLEAQSAQITMESSRTITWTIMLVLIALAGSKKVVVSYFGEDFLVDSGCRTKDETVLR